MAHVCAKYGLRLTDDVWLQNTVSYQQMAFFVKYSVKSTDGPRVYNIKHSKNLYF